MYVVFFVFSTIFCAFYKSLGVSSAMQWNCGAISSITSQGKVPTLKVECTCRWPLAVTTRTVAEVTTYLHFSTHSVEHTSYCLHSAETTSTEPISTAICYKYWSFISTAVGAIPADVYLHCGYVDKGCFWEHNGVQLLTQQIGFGYQVSERKKMMFFIKQGNNLEKQMSPKHSCIKERTPTHHNPPPLVWTDNSYTSLLLD